MSLLVGDITLANLDEDINNSLVFLSKGCGSIYGLQFTLQPSGKPYLTYDEVKSYINLLTSGNGLWDKERLLSPETTEGSLKNVAASIGKRYGLTLMILNIPTKKHYISMIHRILFRFIIVVFPFHCQCANRERAYP